jgi:hypothetical protein
MVAAVMCQAYRTHLLSEDGAVAAFVGAVGVLSAAHLDITTLAAAGFLKHGRYYMLMRMPNHYILDGLCMPNYCILDGLGNFVDCVTLLLGIRCLFLVLSRFFFLDRRLCAFVLAFG